MEIGPHFSDLDALARKRQLEKLDKKSATSSTGASAAEKGSNGNDEVSISRADIARYVDILKEMDPVDLHRVTELRDRIESGDYTSDLDELIDPLLSFLGNDAPEQAAPAQPDDTELA